MYAKKFKQILLVLFFLFAVMAILPACGAPAAEAPAEEPAAEEPAAPEEPAEEQPSEELPVTYGQDSRTEMFQHTDSKLRTMGTSVAVIVHEDQVKLSGDSVTLVGYTLNEMSEKGWLVNGVNAPMCAGELFVDQTAPGFCTGFLVKEDILVTAGHCLDKIPCSDTNVVFGFFMQADNSLATLSKDYIFECTEVIAKQTSTAANQYLDYALIKLDRPTGRSPLEYATDQQLEVQDRVAVIGYPSGLPLKIASDAFVMSNESEDPFFIANLDTFGSNSGSPVINTDTYQVEGIVVSGMPDYALSENGSCVQVNHCPESGGTNCAGENATKMVMLADQISDSKNRISDELNCFPGLLTVLVIVMLVRLK
jgi:V8-like Glu-specific endopeptidase